MVCAVIAAIILIERMSRDAIFGDLVHLTRPDLQFDALARGTYDGGVDGTIIVLLRGRNIILETARNHRPGGVDGAKRAVAVLDAVHNHAKAENIRQLLEGQRLRLHLAKNGPWLLLTTGDLRLQRVF